MTAAAPQGWQPIETAPTDGELVLLWLPDSQMFGEGYAITGWHSARAWRTEFHVTAEPSHWMPHSYPRPQGADSLIPKSP